MISGVFTDSQFLFVLSIIIGVCLTGIYAFFRVSLIKPIWDMKADIKDMREENSARTTQLQDNLLELQKIAVKAESRADDAHHRIDRLEDHVYYGDEAR